MRIRKIGGIVVLLSLLILRGMTVAEEQKPAGEKIQLQWKWGKGKFYRYQQTQEMQMKMSGIPGRPEGSMETSSNQVMVISQKVAEVDENGAATLELKYESIKTEANNPMTGKITFDSTNEEDLKKAEENPAIAPLSLVIGRTFTLKMTNKGEVLEVNGFGKLMEDVLKKLKSEDNPAFKGFVDAFSDKSMAKLFQQGYAQLPRDAIAVGDSWETALNFPIPSLMMLKIKGKSIYEGLETVKKRECAKVTSQMDMTITMDPQGLLGHIPGEMKWEPAPCSVTLYFDPKEGITVSQNIGMKMKCTVSKPDSSKDDEEEGDEEPPAKKPPSEIEMNMEMTVKTELVE